MRTRRDVFQAIADPTRRAIISLIALQAMTPNAVAAHFAITRQAVSKHLQILNDCELITQQRLGREIHYQLKVEKMKEIDRWLEQFRGVWESKFNQLDELFDTLKKPKNET
ncbi:MAG TPA: metalloregulator ArsR/SmtB family transcription factor [Candidatus Sphingobacterium stercorigallinarum]|nr:metalloregulator ArsR/SmtB family transcription factor [Candidatus Sphingobacterium stercorigallinarum]